MEDLLVGSIFRQRFVFLDAARHRYGSSWLADIHGPISAVQWTEDVQTKLATSSPLRVRFNMKRAISGGQSMSLDKVGLKESYDSDQDDTLHDFYVPALGSSYRYDRIAGFFSSSSLAVAAKGLQPFIANGGRMRLVAGAKLTQQDVDAIIEGSVRAADAAETAAVSALSDITDGFFADHVRALSWMVRERRLDIRIALVLDDNGYPVPADRAAEAYFHMKVGVLYDESGNAISFSGSCNETAAGWARHIEEFKVFRNWDDAEKKYFESDVSRFRRFWAEGERNRTLILSFPQALRQRLLDLAPQSAADIQLTKWYSTASAGDTSGVRVRDYQRKAIDAWVANSHRGIFEMATGTGKTIAALQAVSEFGRPSEPLLVVVAAPTIHLAGQWKAEAEKFGLDGRKLIANSSNVGWREEVESTVLDTGLGVFPRAIIFTTHTTLASQDFLDRALQGQMDRLLVVDEVHGAGAPKLSLGLNARFGARLGLSATPARWLDPGGTQYLLDFFDRVVFEFGLEKAIGTVNPETGESYLCPYKYHPILVEMTDAEYADYEKRARALADKFQDARLTGADSQLLAELSSRRQSVVVNAGRKLEALRALAGKLKPVKHALFYCSPQQLAPVQTILNDEGVVQHKFTYRESTAPEAQYGGESEREYILAQFAAGTYDALVAINCLDEGVDIPSTTSAFFVASSGNPRQFIQRRGRVLRRFPGKQFADIYDFIVVPGHEDEQNPDFVRIEKLLMASELARYEEFAAIALNSADADRVLRGLRQKYRM